MTFETLIRSTCPKCNEPKLYVTESRKTKNAQRRRKKCESCGHCLTTYEITQEVYQASKDDVDMLQRLRKLLKEIPSSVIVPELEFLCVTCKFNNGNRCDFDIPEYFTDQAFDCNLVKTK